MPNKKQQQRKIHEDVLRKRGVKRMPIEQMPNKVKKAPMKPAIPHKPIPKIIPKKKKPQ